MAHNLLRPTHLRVEYLENPIGIDVVTPRFSWQLESDVNGTHQTAYQIQVALTTADLIAGSNLVWDSGKVISDESVNIVYDGPPLQPETRYLWRVRIWDQDGEPGADSPEAVWQTGLGDADRWTAQWIAYPTIPDETVRPEVPTGTSSLFFRDTDQLLILHPCAYLRRSFDLTALPDRGLLYITARGLYEAYINGRPITSDRLTPGWTDYHQRIEYQTYDVTSLLQPGENVIAVVLADGWYSGYLGPWGQRATYGEHPSLLCQLNLHSANGHMMIVGSDAAWRGSDGPYRYADLYHGEYYDARIDVSGWNAPEFDDRRWFPVNVLEASSARLSGQLVQPIRVTETLTPIAINQTQASTYLVDMGQVLVGWVRLRVSGSAGTRVQIRHSEALLPDGGLDTTNLGPARATDTYILSGQGIETYEPRFTYHGFRYIEVLGYPGQLTPEDIVGCVVHANLPITGLVETSSLAVNRLFQNTLWSQRGNFNTVPTDCPQRAERLGWTGDMFSFAATGAYLMDTAAYYSRWMQLVVEAQSEAGGFPNVAPRVVLVDDGAPAWGDVGILLPWVIYQMYGDRQIIERHFDAMKHWMNYIAEPNPTFLRLERRGYDFGDWLSYNAFTPTDVVATAIWGMDALWMAQMAEVIGRVADAEGYHQLHANICAAFVNAYVDADGRIQGDTQAAYVLALAARLLPDHLSAAAVQHLLHNLESCGWHPSTGFVATPFLLPLLSDLGYDNVAFRLLSQDTVPSWGYMVKQGATTIWERWDGDIEMRRLHGTDNSPRTFAHPVIGELVGMNSYNHFALGAVTEWFFRYLLGIGIDPLRPGFKHVRIWPRIENGLDYAHGHYLSIRGRIAVSWRKIGDQLRFELQLPANVSATVWLPSTHPEVDAGHIAGAVPGQGVVKIDLLGGNHSFTTSWRAG